MGHKVYSQGNENVLKLICGDGSTTPNIAKPTELHTLNSIKGELCGM